MKVWHRQYGVIDPGYVKCIFDFRNKCDEPEIRKMCKAVGWTFISLSKDMLECKCWNGHLNNIKTDMFINNVEKDLKLMKGTAMFCYNCHE